MTTLLESLVRADPDGWMQSRQVGSSMSILVGVGAARVLAVCVVRQCSVMDCRRCASCGDARYARQRRALSGRSENGKFLQPIREGGPTPSPRTCRWSGQTVYSKKFA